MLDVNYIKSRVKELDLITITREESDPPDIIQEDRILTAIADAQDVVFELWGEKYLYPWSFTNTLAMSRLKRIHFDITMYFLYSLKYDDEQMKDIKERYNKALETLKEYSKEKNFPGVDLNELFRQGITLDSFITNKTEEDIKLHGIFEINS